MMLYGAVLTAVRWFSFFRAAVMAVLRRRASGPVPSPSSNALAEGNDGGGDLEVRRRQTEAAIM